METGLKNLTGSLGATETDVFVSLQHAFYAGALLVSSLMS